MIRYKYRMYILAGLLFLVNTTHAQGAVRTAAWASSDSVSSDSTQYKPFRWAVYPLAYYSPETKIAAGGTATFILKKRNDARASSLIPYFVYTQRKQFIGQIELDFYFGQGIYHLYTMLEYKYYPDKFFGIGNKAPESNEEKYVSTIPLFNVILLRRIHSALNAGLQLDITYHDIVSVKEGGLLENGTIPGSTGGLISGLNLIGTWDTRDNTFSSLRGSYFYGSAGYYGPYLSCDYNFIRLILDLRHFTQIIPRHIFAVQTYFSYTAGDVPLQTMSLMGGSMLMRGFYKGRYRDKNMALMQFEYRLPVYWRFGLAAFVGIGDVFNDLKELGFKHIKTSVGGGIRFALDSKERLVIRADIGIGTGGEIGFYFKAKEAF